MDFETNGRRIVRPGEIQVQVVPIAYPSAFPLAIPFQNANQPGVLQVGGLSPLQYAFVAAAAALSPGLLSASSDPERPAALLRLAENWARSIEARMVELANEPQQSNPPIEK